MGEPRGAMADEMLGTATVLAPGTCGELVQGMTGGTHFLVTCPINQFSRATVTLRVAGSQAAVGNVQGIDHMPKTRRAVSQALAMLSSRPGLAGLTAEVAITNPIPAGKGMGQQQRGHHRCGGSRRPGVRASVHAGIDRQHIAVSGTDGWRDVPWNRAD